MKKKAKLIQRLRMLFSACVTLFVFFIAALLVIEILTPGAPENATIQMVGDAQATSVRIRGREYTQTTSNILTDDYDFLNGRLLVPADTKGSRPLIVISSGFVRMDDMQNLIGPLGDNAVLIYKPPGTNRMRYGRMDDPSADTFFGHMWDWIRLNPIYRALAVRRLMHEGARNIVRLVTWADQITTIDRSRITFIGMDFGTTMISSAIVGLQKKGFTPKASVFIFPTADMAAALDYNLPPFPGRTLVGHFGAFLMRRLDLANTLPKVEGERLLIIPARNLQIPTAAALPAVGYAPDPKTVKHIDLDYNYWNTPQFIDPIRDTVRAWLIEQKAIHN